MAFFSTTALGPETSLFRGRQAELAQLLRLCQGEVTAYVALYGGRQNGKTSLLIRLEVALHSSAIVCRVDFQIIKDALPTDTFAFLAEQIAKVMPLVPEWRGVRDGPTLQEFLSQALVRSDAKRLVLLLDELGALPAATREVLAHALRSLFHARLVVPALTKLQILFSGGVELYDLVITEASSLYNICEPVYLADLAQPEAVALVANGLQACGLHAEAATALAQGVYTQAHGHPYLTQKLGGLLERTLLAGARLGPTSVEQAALQVRQGGDPLLRRIRDDLREYGLEEATRRLLRDPQPFNRLNDQMARLELIGLAKPDGARWVPRNPLLAAVFREQLGLPPARAPRVRALPKGLFADRSPSPQPEAPSVAPKQPEAPAVQPQLPITAPEAPRPVAPSAVKPASVVIVPRPRTARRLSWAGVVGLLLVVVVVSLLGLTWVRRGPVSVSMPTATMPVFPATPLPAWVPKLVKVPAGPFLMGSSDADTQAQSNEKTQHTLTLPDYWIGKTEVTNAQFRPFVEGDGYTNQAYWTAAGWAWRQAEKITQPLYWNDAKWNGPDYPVVGVSWFEAVAYCRWLSKQTGIEFRLPSEAEWEKAARGTDGLIWPWGNTWDASLVNSSESGLNKTTPVGSYPKGASPYGALDMAGNVWEWCATQWRKVYPYQLEDEWQTTYLEATADYRVFRGGSSWDESTYVRGAYRSYYYPRDRFNGFGLRVASHSLVP